MLLYVGFVTFIIVFIVYVIYSPPHIKHRLKLISDHLNINDDGNQEEVSNEEIEKELTDKLK
ncbi:MAG TPA: hypothetical protein VK142_05165 [Bacillota bacterium]|nr:hypothetical protein [Bacillota bacterium]